jgi:hypothetical protein
LEGILKGWHFEDLLLIHHGDTEGTEEEKAFILGRGIDGCIDYNVYICYPNKL